MGNLCGKESSDNFATPGRTLASVPAQSKTSSPPTNSNLTPVSRPLGSNNNNNNNNNTPTNASEARRKAAEAAEARAKAKDGQGGGKLTAQLEAQRRKTRGEVLGEVSGEERRRREVEAVEVDRAHN